MCLLTCALLHCIDTVVQYSFRYTDKAENDLQRLADENSKTKYDLQMKYEAMKADLIAKLEAQHLAEMARQTKMWEAKCAVSSAAVKALDNPELTASIVERQRRVTKRIMEVNATYRPSAAFLPSLTSQGVL